MKGFRVIWRRAGGFGRGRACRLGRARTARGRSCRGYGRGRSGV